jgi:hypothetical protein
MICSLGAPLLYDKHNAMPMWIVAGTLSVGFAIATVTLARGRDTSNADEPDAPKGARLVNGS